jgi:hypothetical protein
MLTRKIATILTVSLALLLVAGSTGAQDVKGSLAKATHIKCTFPLMVVGTWSATQPEAKVKPTSLLLEFENIKADEGTADLNSTYGKYDIIVRYVPDGYLHFIQSFLNGPLYTTTILEKKTASGKLKAMHSRHEFMDFALPGITSSPEQYYGECEVIQ